MLVQLSDPLLTPLLGSWRLDPLSMQVLKKIMPAHARSSVEAALKHSKMVGNEDTFRRFLIRCQDDKIVIGVKTLTFYHYGKPPFSLPIQKVVKDGRKTLLHCIQKPPYPVGPVVYSFHFFKDRLVMSEHNSMREKAITHKFYANK